MFAGAPRRPGGWQTRFHVMQPSIWMMIGVAAYIAALGLEVGGLWRPFRGRRAFLGIATAIGLTAQGTFLCGRALALDAVPLASPAEWLLVAAWALALAYLAAQFYLPATATGLLLLPLVLGLLAASHSASHQPFAAEPNFYVWGMVHGLALLLGTVAVCVGFLAGAMYVLQNYALKHPRRSTGGLRLPSLERLEWINTRSLAVSTLLVALGFASGLVLSILAHRGDTAHVLWTDPVVLSSGTMLAWLASAEVFRLIYPAARRGRKMAYLTLASFVFVVITVLSVALVESSHKL